jgi:hypothetical protein
MKALKIAIGLRLATTDHKKIIFISQKNKRSLNAQIEFVVQECIEKFEQEHGKIKITSDN